MRGGIFKMKMHNLKRIISICLILVFAVVLVGNSMPTTKVAAKQSISDMKKEYNALEEKAKALQDKVKASKNKINKTEQEIEDIKDSINVTKDQIELLNNKINDLDEEIEELEQEIKLIEESIEANYGQFKKRLRAMYMAGNLSDLEILLGAKNLGDYLTKEQLVKSVATHDKELLESIKDSLAAVQKKSKEVEDKKNETADLKDAAERKTKYLKQQYTENKELVEDLEKTMAEDKEALAEANKAKEKQEAAINAAIAAAARAAANGEAGAYQGVSSKGFMWPVVGSSYVSSGYGYRPAFGKFHYGLDITGGNIYGRSVVASKSGLVLISGWTNIGYGNYVVLDNGGGVTTIYGHCSSLCCKAGQVVKQGDVIAKVGSTGWSTGPHLHFEIKINGQNVNPAAYF
jgi:murein DD-endopeptidase MepM/ murein hydrolase activator NlpD